MSFDILILNIVEWIALICWAIHFNKKVSLKNKLFTIYLLIIAVAETLNIFWGRLQFKTLDILVNQLIVPTEFLMIYFYLLWQKVKGYKELALLFSATYLLFYTLDRINFFEKKTLFDSLSYGVGCLFVISSVVLATRNFLNQQAILNFTKNSLFWMLLGITIFYLGSFPYHNFRTYLWSNKQYHNLAYILHYVSQVFCIIMYLFFAYAAKWIVK